MSTKRDTLETTTTQHKVSLAMYREFYNQNSRIFPEILTANHCLYSTPIHKQSNASGFDVPHLVPHQSTGANTMVVITSTSLVTGGSYGNIYKAKLFTPPSNIIDVAVKSFRRWNGLTNIDIRRVGGSPRRTTIFLSPIWLDSIRELYERAVSGETFATTTSSHSRDYLCQRAKGTRSATTFSSLVNGHVMEARRITLRITHNTRN